MKYLFNADFRASMKGEYVTVSEEAEDFIYDTDEDVLTSSQIKEIAKANDITLRGKKVSELKASLNAGLTKLKLAEKKEKSLSEKVKEIVKAGSEEEKTEDEILIEIVQSGVKFQKAGKLMQNAMIDLGLMLSAKDRYVKSKKLMEADDFDPETFSEVRKMAEKLTKKVAATSEIQAFAQIKKYCKENEIAMPVKPKEVKVPFAITAMLWIAQNLKAKDSEMEDWMEEDERPEKLAAGWLKKFQQIKNLEKVNAELHGEEEGEEEE